MQEARHVGEPTDASYGKLRVFGMQWVGCCGHPGEGCRRLGAVGRTLQALGHGGLDGAGAWRHDGPDAASA